MRGIYVKHIVRLGDNFQQQWNQALMALHLVISIKFHNLKVIEKTNSCKSVATKSTYLPCHMWSAARQFRELWI